MITLSKLAKLASVSVSTASKAFSMSREVNEETREAIFRIARENGCFKKFYNAKYPKLVIAIVCPEIHSPHYSDFIERIRALLEEENCEVCVASTNFSRLNASSLIEYYSKYTSVDGMILFGNNEELTVDVDIPVVSLYSSPDFSSNGAFMDYSTGVDDAVSYLTSRGIMDIGFIGEKLTSTKLSLFKDSARKLNIPISEDMIVVTEERFEECGYKGVMELASLKRIPRALICAYDSIAQGAMRALCELGYSVPGDVAIVGMDNMPFCSYTTPSLSSVALDNGEISKYISDTIINILRGNDCEKRRHFKSRFIARESTEV